MDVQYSGFYAQRIRKEREAKDRFDKVVHLHKQVKLANTIASGFTTKTSASNHDIMRSRIFANQEAMVGNTQKPG